MTFELPGSLSEDEMSCCDLSSIAVGYAIGQLASAFSALFYRAVYFSMSLWSSSGETRCVRSTRWRYPSLLIRFASF